MLIWNSGCGPAIPKPPEAASVDGTITLNDKPVRNGEIHFSMLGAPPAVLEIDGGSFSGEVPVGEHQVEVYIYVVGPPNPRFPDEPARKNVAPEKYWGPKTILKEMVKAGEVNTFKFKL